MKLLNYLRIEGAMFTLCFLIHDSGLYKSHGGATNSLWNTENGKPILSNNISLHNFQRISRQIQFDDRETTLHCHEKDLLAAMRDMWDDWVACLSMMLNPGAYVTATDSIQRKWLISAAYAEKPAKYGIKVWNLCDAKTSCA
ncbi:hypothetical protein T4C_10334 [Trichinella pseudospiralis]|uniref:PiggyBac transposable element-derived protein domain-containing protein n=1 Tax=Trichinella pseudospiralis TaxID=6337 RepID=A0A0V1JMN7_TRIPS|nr:hypothetical protein T4C_10334 [Trichinella pseudospiralis]